MLVIQQKLRCLNIPQSFENSCISRCGIMGAGGGISHIVFSNVSIL